MATLLPASLLHVPSGSEHRAVGDATLKPVDFSTLRPELWGAEWWRRELTRGLGLAACGRTRSLPRTWGPCGPSDPGPGKEELTLRAA